jgi:hypothetical protein
MPRSKTLASRSRRLGHGRCSLESLETRLVYSAPHEFAGVGIRFDDGPRLFYAQGVVDANDDITGTMQFADATGLLSTDPMDWTRLVRGDAGAMTFDTRNGFTPYASQTGTQFIVEDRWLRGSFVGRDADGATRDFAVLAELENSGLSPYFRADIGMTRINAQGELEGFNLEIALTPDAAPGTSYRLTYQLPGGDVVVDVEPTFEANGIIGLGAHGNLIVPHRSNGSMSAVMLSDFDNSDGIVAIGVGRIGGDSLEEQAGRFRSAVLVQGPVGAAFFGVDPQSVPAGTGTAANVVIELSYWSNDAENAPASTFRVYRQDQFDQGMRTPVTQGTFRLRQDDGLWVIELASDQGTTVRVLPSAPRTLVFNSVNDGQHTESLQGMGAAIVYRNGALLEFTAGYDADGRLMAYLEYDNGDSATRSRYSVDLLAEVGGEAVTGEIVTWSTNAYSTHDWYVAARSTDGDLLVWRMFADNVSWSFVNMTEALPGARPITSELSHTLSGTTFNSFYDGYREGGPYGQTLAGFDADGNFVVYQWTDVVTTPEQSLWTFRDVGGEGLDGSAMPTLVGGLSGWGSDWGASHFAGVDAGGELWSIWWAPGMDHWRVDSLSESAGIAPLAPGRPAAVSTRWNAFHVSAVDLNGHLVMTWWAPGFDTWRGQDLTADFAGPTLEVGVLAADFNRYTNNLNIVGRDADGHARIYWWNFNSGWNVGDLSAGLAPGSTPMTPWRMTYAHWTDNIHDSLVTTQSLEGYDDDGDLVRIVWSSGGPDAWVLEDISVGAIAYGV